MFKLFLLFAFLISLASAACPTESYIRFSTENEIPFDIKILFDTCYGWSWECLECPATSDCDGLYVDECLETMPSCMPDASFKVSNGTVTLWPYDPTCTEHPGIATVSLSKGTVNGVFSVCAMRMFNATVAMEASICTDE